MEKIKIWLIDHYHLLFKSAAYNHLRIQNLLKNSDGSYEAVIKFDSYSELKKYQKKIRRVTVSLSSSVAMIIVAIIVSPYIMNPSRSSAASFQWVQSSWGGAANGDAATKNNWTNYSFKDANIAATEDGISLTLSQIESVQEDSDGDFTGTKEGDGFYVDGSGKLLLKKPAGAACTIAAECASDSCTGLLCT